MDNKIILDKLTEAVKDGKIPMEKLPVIIQHLIKGE